MPDVPDNIRIYDRFEYYEEDCLCEYCLLYAEIDGSKKRECKIQECCCEDVRADAIANGRLIRERGWNK